MKPEQVIADFLMSAFDDSRLAVLRADAVAGKVPYMGLCVNKCGCLVEHVDGRLYRGILDTAERQGASQAYYYLDEDADEDDNKLRQQRLIPLIDAEINRRAVLRSEALAAAKEVCLVTADDLVTVEV